MPASDECLEPDELAAWAEGRLDDAERARIVAHVAGCETCREAGSALAQLQDEPVRTDAEPVFEVGERVGRFRIVEVLGRGGMGVVLRARDERLERDVAIKVRRGGGAPDAKQRERFAAEARALAALSHENLVTVYEAGEIAGAPFLVMALVEGKTLRAHVTEQKPVWHSTLDLCIAAARGLAALHHAGFVHRDVKPDNVLVAHDGRVLLADLGLAKRIEADDGDTGLTQTGAIVGTPKYLAPERVAGHPGGVRADVYALAAMTLEVLRQSTGDVPAAVQAVLTRGMDPEPERRFAGVDEMVAALQAAAKSRRALWALAGSVVIVLGAGAIYALQSDDTPPTVASAEPAAQAPAPTPTHAPTAEPAPVAVAPAPSIAEPSATVSVTASSSAPAPAPSPTPTLAPAPSLAPAPAPSLVLTPSGSAPIVINAPVHVAPLTWSDETLKRLGRVPLTAELGEKKWAERISYNACGQYEGSDETPKGLDWGKVEKREVIEVPKPDGGKDPMIAIQLQGRKKRWVFDSYFDGGYIDAPVGSTIFFCPGGPEKHRPHPPGFQGEFVTNLGVGGPIKDPPDFWIRKPRPKPISGPVLKEGKWPFGSGPVIFALRDKARETLDSGRVAMGIYYLDLPGGDKQRELVVGWKPAEKRTVWVVGEFVGFQEREGTQYPVLKVVDVRERLFGEPVSLP